MTAPFRTFSWIDLASRDPEGAADFYGALLGWAAEPVAEGYWYLRKEGRKAAGLGALQGDEHPAMWSSYVLVEDVDGIAERVVELGGRVDLPPTDVFDAGRMAFVADPTGGAFGLWQPGTHRGADGFGEPGFLVWNELASTDPGRAVAFYAELFGWEPEEQTFFEGFRYTTFHQDGRPVGGAFDGTAMLPAGTPSRWYAYVAIEDTDAAVATARAQGGTVLGGPQDTPFGRMALIADPEGAEIALIRPAPDGDDTDG